jgi:hypothetical protein
LALLCAGCGLPFATGGSSGPLTRAALWSNGSPPTVAYPRSWVLDYEHDLVGGTFGDHLGVMTNDPSNFACAPGTVTLQCASARLRLAPGQVFATWNQLDLAPFLRSFSDIPGKTATVDGLPVRLVVHPGTYGYVCIPGTDETIQASFAAAPNVTTTYYRMTACLRGPHLARLRKQVLAMVRSYRWH